MEKNMTVIDEEGNIIGATYAKRAKGLIKKGRARSVDDTTICLACPPNESLEDIKMDNNNIETNTNAKAEEKVTLKYVLDKLDEVRKSFLESEQEQISLICSPNEMDPDSLDPELLPSIFQNYYDSITKIKTLSQTTLQQFLGVYTSMINELKQSEVAAVINPEERKEFYNLVEQYAEKAAPGVLVPDFAAIARVLYGINSE